QRRPPRIRADRRGTAKASAGSQLRILPPPVSCKVQTAMSISQATLDQLAKFDTPTICNVIELFDIRPRNVGYTDHRIQCNFPEFPPMVGFASTAAFRSDAPAVGGDAYGSMDQQVAGFAELPGPAIVVFQDLDDPPVAATFGEVMCATYQAFGAAGLITSGGGRDLEQVRAQIGRA